MSFVLYIPKNEEDWLHKRFNGIGASESAIVLGVSKWKTPLELYYEKVQKHTFGNSGSDSNLLRAGNFLEPSILKWFEADTGIRTEHNDKKIIYINQDRPYIFCTPDGFTIEDSNKGFCEAKLSPFGKRHGMWDNGIPLNYQIQLQHQMLCGELDKIYFVALIEAELFTQTVYRNDAFISVLKTKLEEFWEQVQDEKPPKYTVNDWKFLNYLYTPKQNITVKLPDTFIKLDEELNEISQQIKQLNKRKKEIEVTFKSAIGDAEQGNLSNGIAYTFKQIKRKGYTVEPSVSRKLTRKGETK